MRPGADIVGFMTRLGHDFARPELLVRALTHGSIATATRPDNQRLEFLGDRVLGLVMAEALFQADPAATEGQLAPRYNALVRGETCAAIARRIGLGEVLKLGRSEMMSGGRRKEALLADAMEAVIAAIYLDAGFDAARQVVLILWRDRLDTLEDDPRDAKTALQEWAQANGMPPPVYEQTARSGPDHAPVFHVTARLADGREAQAQGVGTKRSVEQAAAQALLARLEDR
ncbi:MAG: ribonuclease III [Paracoccus sp. (in: a-proteobacteria)]|uniref:ribonuclease III n=1 Tax=unclassified Paracoccus (in: a-proteobacteria) TaxID=2688777 RepID=UPI000C657987|nr:MULTISPECIES: ribonuclease III [unclassified Paracoccus (in: a-proteobacteria)]MBA50394.1 ribonuclease III [Paracoccus sp. (in: a-proteobacteria)]MDB2552070.1 ribonuclease III [Paracoccus sp. (in: a-proteobacteria)]HIC66788.1 ribonuclease III [Paracoccus sp. (in: a-proteobacteria)]